MHQYTNIMRGIHFLLLLSLLLAACSDDDKEKQPAFVTNITISDADKTFDPGDAVTVKADGFQSGDQIILDIYWPIADNPLFPEGYSRYIHAVTTEQTANSITFLAPGHWPASRVEIFLTRMGQLQLLGKTSVSDGQSPQEPQLYGITNSRSNAVYPFGIEHVSLDASNTSVTPVVRLPEGQEFSLAVNNPGSNCLYGVLEQDGLYATNCFDLSMHYWKGMRNHFITLCETYENRIMAIGLADEKHLTIYDITSSYTRNSTVNPPLIELPEGLNPEALGHYPGVQGNESCILLSADNGDGTFSPAVIYTNNGQPYMRLYAPIRTDALIPFQIIFRAPNTEAAYYIKAGGYVISSANGGDTELCLWKVSTEEMEEPFTTFPNPARSVTTFSTEHGTQKLYVLFEGSRNGNIIEAYDPATEKWEFLNSGFPYSEIVLAR